MPKHIYPKEYRHLVPPDQIPEDLDKLFDLKWYAEHMLLTKQHLDIINDYVKLPPQDLFIKYLAQHHNDPNTYRKIYPSQKFITSEAVFWEKDITFNILPTNTTSPTELGIAVHITIYGSTIGLHLWKGVWYDKEKNKVTTRVNAEIVRV